MLGSLLGLHTLLLKVQVADVCTPPCSHKYLLALGIHDDYACGLSVDPKISASTMQAACAQLLQPTANVSWVLPELSQNCDLLGTLRMYGDYNRMLKDNSGKLVLQNSHIKVSQGFRHESANFWGRCSCLMHNVGLQILKSPKNSGRRALLSNHAPNEIAMRMKQTS